MIFCAIIIIAGSSPHTTNVNIYRNIPTYIIINFAYFTVLVHLLLARTTELPPSRGDARRLAHQAASSSCGKPTEDERSS
eukprot:scaffold212858_cov18-Prasinocladus_malaysianus.AAC.2